MTRPSGQTPRPSAPASAGQAQKPGRLAGNAEVFGRFVGNLARLEGNARQGRKGKEGSR